jgi:hypothetical protein
MPATLEALGTPSLRRSSQRNSAKLVSACSVTVVTDRYHTWLRENPGWVESHTAGSTKVMRREPELASDGQVLPSYWNTPEQVKMSPVATKLSEITRR